MCDVCVYDMSVHIISFRYYQSVDQYKATQTLSMFRYHFPKTLLVKKSPRITTRSPFVSPALRIFHSASQQPVAFATADVGSVADPSSLWS